MSLTQRLAPLPIPPTYFPLERGLYEVAPGLRPLGFDFGNGLLDQKIFQFDQDFSKYRQNRLHARSEDLHKYYLSKDFSVDVEKAFSCWMVERLVQEWPDYFQLQKSANGQTELTCHLTSEILFFDASFRLQNVFHFKKDSPSSVRTSAVDVQPPYVSSFDALCSQVQEDIAVLAQNLDRNWLACIHLCAPNHWAAKEKIGKDFAAIHAPIPGIEKINFAAKNLVQGMIEKGPLVRFAWGISTDDRLNHHPQPALNSSIEHWHGRKLDLANQNENPFYLRIERQTTFGLPAVSSAVFTIRTLFLKAEDIRKDAAKSQLLTSAFQSMTSESLKYKGMSKDDRESILNWLSSAN